MTAQDWLDFATRYGTPVLGSLIVLVIAYFAAKWIKRLVLTACTRGAADPTVGRFLGKLVGLVIVLIALSIVFNKFGFETASFSVLLGAVGLAIGLAFQGTLSNFASGLMLMIFRPYKIGDTIIAAGQTGTVFEIDLFSTTLDSVDNRRIFIPNSSIFGSVITNISYHEKRRVDIVVVVAHSADVDATRAALAHAAGRAAPRLPDPSEIVLHELGTAGVSWQVQVWTSSANYIVVRQSVLRETKMALDAAGIAFALPPGVVAR